MSFPVSRWGAWYGSPNIEGVRLSFYPWMLGWRKTTGHPTVWIDIQTDRPVRGFDPRTPKYTIYNRDGEVLPSPKSRRTTTITINHDADPSICKVWPCVDQALTKCCGPETSGERRFGRSATGERGVDQCGGPIGDGPHCRTSMTEPVRLITMSVPYLQATIESPTSAYLVSPPLNFLQPLNPLITFGRPWSSTTSDRRERNWKIKI